MGEMKKSTGMNIISKTVFAPIYPVIAHDILDKCGISGGLCIDLGSGPGMLSIALASLAKDLEIMLADSSPEAGENAARNIHEGGFDNRLTPLLCDVHHLPFKDNSIDLAISRGSIFFWDDPSKVLMEVHRVLAKGGRSYIGGGFGNEQLKESISRKMIEINPDWPSFTKKNLGQENRRRLAGIMESLGIPYRIHEDNAGFWIIISK